MSSPTTRCAIFCRVIDNFGDAGVCWRLARQLVEDYQWQVTLYIDPPERLTPLTDVRDWPEISVRPWIAASEAPIIPEVVIEAFACDLPEEYIDAMVKKDRPPAWINLEYLSAESWVDGCHGIASPHAFSHLVKHFFFPGFSDRSGGVLRERHYLERQKRFDPVEFCREWSIPWRDNELRLSYFAYPRAPLDRLIDSLALSDYPVRLLMPGGTSGGLTVGSLSIQPIPFLPQSRYDELLWLCDLNFVRGEDSFVRAQLAGRPFIWTIYEQSDAAHESKLTAFLDKYLNLEGGDPRQVALSTQELATIRNAWWSWNAGEMFDWREFARQLPRTTQFAHQWRDVLFGQADLAAQLVRFCDGLRVRIE